MNILYPMYTLRFVDDNGNIIYRYKHNVGIDLLNEFRQLIYVYKTTKDKILCIENTGCYEINKLELSPDEFVSRYCGDWSGYNWKYQKEWVIKNHEGDYIFPGEIVTINSYINSVYGTFEYTGIKRGACGTFVIFRSTNITKNYDGEFLEFGNSEYTGNIPEDKIEYIPLFNDYKISKPQMKPPRLD